MSVGGFVYKADAVKDPGCKACAQDWPIHQNEKGERVHVDLFATPEFGVVMPCPTQDWPDEEPDDEEGGTR